MFVTVDALGLPIPQGSKRVVRGHLIDANATKLRPWRAVLAAAAWDAMDDDEEPTTEAVRVHATFYFPRPRHHYGTGRNAEVVKPSAPVWVAVRPDLDKLERALLDALTGVVWRDDAQVVAMNAAKVYTVGVPHVRVIVQDASPWG
jgi:Holliday junction resolvase RusA-like endonuclease